MSVSIGLSHELVGYLGAHNPPEHPILRRCRAETLAMGEISRMQISAEQGSLMQLLAKMAHARTALEIGVFTGYSSLAVALAMQSVHGAAAKLYALDVSADYTAKAKDYWAAAGVAENIELRLAPAAETLAQFVKEERGGSFDFAFVDADKTGYMTYYDRCLSLLRPGGLMLFDNMLWSGTVADPMDQDEDTVALRELAVFAKKDNRVDMALTAVGDGLLICRKR